VFVLCDVNATVEHEKTPLHSYYRQGLPSIFYGTQPR
jgi:hypothetical protein